MAFASVYAISWCGSAPASCRWYEHTFIGFHFGTSLAQNVTMSVMRRIDGSGGNMYVPRERYSFKMSFCVVPIRAARSTLCSSATAMYSAKSHIAVALIVIDVFMSSSGIPSNSARMSSIDVIGTPTFPTSPDAIGASAS